MNGRGIVARRRRFVAGCVAVLFVAVFAAGGIAATGSLGSFKLAGSSSDTTSTDTTSTDTTSTDTTSTDTTSTDTTSTDTTSTDTTSTETTAPTSSSSSSCATSGAISTDKSSYAPGETVHITGAGFGPSCDVSLRITLPDGSTSTDGAGTDADGDLTYDYAIPSSVADGPFSVEVLGDGGAVLASAGFAVTSGTAVSCSATATESVSTDKPSYTAGQTAHISGSGFAPACDVVVRITVPGGSTTTLNTTSGAGGFSVDYTTPGVPAPTGVFAVDVLGLADAVLASTTFETVAGVVSSPSVSSNKGDYDPGEWVTLSGTGWQPAEHVHIVVNDDIGQSWSHVADVTASAGGTFTDEFQLPNAFVADYSVTATGDTSGTATTTFTDAQTGYQEGSGTWTGTCSSPTNALTNDSNRAACEPSGEYVDGQGFGLDSLVPADATGMSFTVFVNGQAQNNDNTDVWRVSLSWNGGTSFTSTTDSTDVFTSSGSDADAFIPSSTTCSTFGHTWTYSELSNANFRVRVAAIPDTGTGESMSIDDIDVRVCYGDYSINASVAGATSAVSSPSAAIPAAVEVQHTNASGTSNWNSTKYQVEGQSAVCVNHGNNSDSGSGTDTEGFNVTAPSAHGTYDVTFTPYEDDGCSTGTFTPITLTDAITVGIFGDSFGITGPDTVPGWTDSDGGGSDAALRTRTGIIDPNAYVRLRGSSVTSSYQEGAGTWTGTCSSPTNAVTSNDSRALCDSGENVVASGFGLDSVVPTGASNISFKVRVEGRVSNTSDNDVFGVQLSWNGGTNFTGTTNTGEVDNSFSGSDDTNTAPSSEESCGTFGRTWSASELSDANFRVRVAAAPSTSTDDMDIDDIDVLVCFDGPNSVTKSGISTAGLGNIHLKYKWGQQADNDGDGAGDLLVQWKRSVDSTWTDVNTHNLVDNSTTNPTTAEDEGLGASAGNTSIDIRFLGNTPESDDQARVDDVLVTGSASVASDAPTVDSPICAGATSVAGTSTEAPGTTIEVFKNGSSVGTTTVSGGTWTKSSLAALVAGNQIKARATAAGETTSGDSNVVTVVNCNTVPTAVDDTYSTNEDTNLTLDDVAAGANDSPVDNDTDGQNDTLTVTNVTGATHGTVDLTAGTITFDPDTNYCGSGVDAGGFNYTVSDGSLTDTGHVTVDITCDNDPPVCTAVSITTNEDTAGSTSPSCTDVDDTVASLTYSVTQPTKGVASVASLDFDPNGEFEGLDDTESDTTNGDFTYRAYDGDDYSVAANVAVTVTGVNDAPVCEDVSITTDEDTIGSVAADCSDVDGEALTISVTQPTKGVSSYVNPDLRLNPNNQYNGLNTGDSDTVNGDFTYKANDSTVNSANANVAVTVTGTDDNPTITNGASSTRTAQYTDPITSLTINATDVDNPGSDLTFTWKAGDCSSAGTPPNDIDKVDAAGNGSLPGSRSTTISGRYDVKPNTYNRCIVVSDGDGGSATHTIAFVVTKEDASVTGILPTEVQVGAPGGTGTAALSGTFAEDSGNPSTSLAAPNTSATAFSETNVRFDLSPVGSGSGGTCTDTGVANPVGCTISALTPDVYQVDVTIVSDWFTGGDIVSLLVFDPSLGFSTGGGTFVWPSDSSRWAGSKTNFGFVGKQVNTKSWKGSILIVIHTSAGPYVVKTNAFNGVTNGLSGGIWYTSMTGKATYAVPTGSNPGCSTGILKCGNFTVSISAQDKAEPGKGIDTFKAKLLSPTNATLFDLAYQTITGGNIQVPHR
jgi:Bacterial Ig domain/Bacterial cadherin-like domain